MKPKRLIAILSVFLVSSALLACAGLRAKDPAQAEFDLGLSLFNRGLFEEALPHFERATEHKPDFGEAYLYLGRSYISLGRWAEALHPLRTAYRLAPEETKKEIMEIILDLLIKNAAGLNPDTLMEFKGLLERP
jgi:tetratricopeptide (TPR) repeat protein